MYQRLLQKNIEKWLFKDKIIILYGARQVGKTTLVKQIVSKFPKKQVKYFSADEEIVRNQIKPTSYLELKNAVGEPDILIIDEAQRITDIGLVLKILFDNNPKTQIIVTGSSSLDLANKVNEPLTGRSVEFTLFPLSIQEVAQNGIEAAGHLTKFLTMGSYPGIFTEENELAKKLLKTLTEQYLYRDLLEFEKIKKPKVLAKLLQLLALQIGNEVSFSELSQTLEIDKKTVETYIDLLEKSFVVFTLPAFAKNSRSEISRNKKIYFWDLGVRNALIEGFLPLDIRSDLGQMFENLVVVEKCKKHFYDESGVRSYFWRNYQQQEVDLVEQKGEQIKAFEIKYSPKKKAKLPKSFSQAYPDSSFEIINSDNWFGLV